MTLTKLVNGQRVQLDSQEQTDIENEWVTNLEAQQDNDAQFGYLDQRRREYPPLDESIEAIFEGFNAINDNILFPLPASTMEWINQMQAIYDANPEP